MKCIKCGRELRFISERNLEYRKHKKYKCDNCNEIVELEIDKNDKIVNTNRYKDNVIFMKK